MATSRKKSPTKRKPSREEAEAAVRTLLAWVGACVLGADQAPKTKAALEYYSAKLREEGSAR